MTDLVGVAMVMILFPLCAQLGSELQRGMVGGIRATDRSAVVPGWQCRRLVSLGECSKDSGRPKARTQRYHAGAVRADSGLTAPARRTATGAAARVVP